MRIICLLLLASTMSAQIRVELKNKKSGEPVAYANIWKENRIYASSDSLGVFYLQADDRAARIKISAVGYRTADSLEITQNQTVYLEETIVALDNIPLRQRTNGKKIKIGKLKNGDAGIVSRMDDLVPMTAKYFPNQSGQDLFLDCLKIKAHASTKNRIAAVSFFTVGTDGKPDEPINNSAIICRFKKGHGTSEVDLKQLNLPLPAEGIFVVINHLQLEQNRHYPFSTNWFFYEPSFDAVATDNPDCWFFGTEGWKKNEKYSLSMQLIVTE